MPRPPRKPRVYEYAQRRDYRTPLFLAIALAAFAWAVSVGLQDLLTSWR